jgi:hypothetical protein
VQSLLHHHKPSGDHRALPCPEPYVGNLPPIPGVFPDYPASVIRNTGDGREMTLMRWSMPPPPKIGGRIGSAKGRQLPFSLLLLTVVGASMRRIYADVPD